MASAAAVAPAIVRATIVRSEWDRSWNRMPDTTFDIEGASEDEVFATYFREYRNRYKYCNGIDFSFQDAALQPRFAAWMSDVRNYADNGGDMW